MWKCWIFGHNYWKPPIKPEKIFTADVEKRLTKLRKVK